MSRRRRMTPRRSPEDNVRVAAGWILDRTLASAAPVTSFLHSALPRFDERDQGLLRELVLGSLRWRRFLDHVIASASHRSFDDIERPLRAPLRVAAYQLLFLPRIPPYAAVDEAVEQARSLTHRGGASFANAVLRKIARRRDVEDWPIEETDEATRLGVRFSHPDFLVRRWRERFGAEATREILEANNRVKPLQILAFRDRGGRELLAERLIDEGLDVEPCPISPLGLTVRRGDPFSSAAFADGSFYVQDEGSQTAALVPPPREGERFFDAAGAPGGKTFAALAWDPEIRPLLADVDLGRLATVRENLSRLRRELPLFVADACRPPLGEACDRVVVDLPCSGTGTLRKHPELKWRLTEAEIGRLAREAGRMLSGVAPVVAPGGLLVAITCSIEAEENEEVMEAFFDRHPDFEPAALEASLPASVAPGCVGPGLWRLLPGGDHDGFTVSVGRRRTGR